MMRSTLLRVSGVAVAALAAAGGLAACDNGESSSSSDGTTPSVVTAQASSSAAASTDLSVSAAASLKTAFTTLASSFEKSHPGVTVKLEFDGSATLANQINQGSPVDVFASADEKNMTKIGDKALDPKTFATNTLVIVTAPGNPKGVNSLKDLQRSDVTTAQCAVPQPCGNASVAVERNAGVTIKPVTEEPSVTSVLTKVTTGQVDAGLVYVSDAKSAGDKVTTVEDPAFATVVNKYPITVVKGTSKQDLGNQFETLVLSSEGRDVLTSLGFGAP
ncbi:molybdate ABC transporter substrate-binding protein [Gordonia jinhuaensis]|nr:molybdate ABC transporter substrate-binding protein [Gordonia jinhuaensis]